MGGVGVGGVPWLWHCRCCQVPLSAAPASPDLSTNGVELGLLADEDPVFMHTLIL